MKIINTIFDLIDHINTVTDYPERKAGEIGAIVSTILLRDDWPAFGSDWDTFLSALPEQIFRV